MNLGALYHHGFNNNLPTSLRCHECQTAIEADYDVLDDDALVYTRDYRLDSPAASINGPAVVIFRGTKD